MRKSTRALLGMVVLDVLVLLGTSWMVMQVRSGAWKTTGSPGEAIGLITTTGGAVIGIVSAVLIMAFFLHRKRGN